jgi:hypothetical protein
MHCGICGNTTVEVRPADIGEKDLDRLAKDLKVFASKGDIYLCQKCVNRINPFCRDSYLITWTGFPCDDCSQLAAFDGDIDDLPTGIVCADCVSHLDENARFGDSTRGMWLCEPCFDARHLGHKQMQLQPILDRLSKL